MHRALVIAGVMLAGLLAAAPTAGAAPQRPPSTGFAIEEVSFHRRVGAYVVDIQAREDASVTLAVRRGPYLVIYGASEAGLEGRTISARFGGLGSLRLTYDGPVRHARRCGGRSEGGGAFKGKFEFHGEEGYLDFAFASMQGDIEVLSTCPGVRPRRAEAVEPTEPSATLAATTAGPLPRESLAAVGTHTVHGRFQGSVFGGVTEHKEGMFIGRTTFAKVGRSQFRWNLTKGIATVRPGGPFDGYAIFHRHPRGAAPRLTGNLRVPTLGGPELALTGKRFKAKLTNELPYDE